MLYSHFSLGYFLLERKRYREAAEHLHEVINLAWKNREVPQKKLREFVYQTLGWLFEIFDLTNGKVPALPTRMLKEPVTSDEPILVYLTEFDLSKEAERQRLVDMVIGKGFAAFPPHTATRPIADTGKKKLSLPRGRPKQQKKRRGR